MTMRLADLKGQVPGKILSVISKVGIDELRPCQAKAVDAGLLEGKNLLVCTPTASGKTLIAEIAALKAILEHQAKAVYIVPLKALASEKYKEFKNKWGHLARVALSIGDTDSAENYLADYDLIVVTSEKLDSLLRHRVSWISRVRVLVVDEIHLLDDASRGPTLEILITLLRQRLPNLQVLALSATIGNPQELADWLDAELIVDTWRPVTLYKGIYYNGTVTFEIED